MNKLLLLLLLPAMLWAQPQVTGRIPAIGAVGVSRTAPLELFFDRLVLAGPNNVLIRDAQGNLLAQVPPEGLIIAFNHVTIPLPQPLPLGITVVVNDAAIVRDWFSMPYTGSGSSWTFSTETLNILQFVPDRFAQQVPVSSDLSMTFDHPVTAGPGVVEIRRASDGSVFQSFAATDLSIYGPQVTIDPAAPLHFGTQYLVYISPDAFHDGAGAYFPGSDGFAQPWTFGTEAFRPLNFSPVDDAVDVAVGATLSLTFNGDVEAGPGVVEIRRASDGSVFQSFAATDLSIYGPQVTIDPAAPLHFGTQYLVYISPDAFHDGAGVYFPGSGSFAQPWTFGTEAFRLLTLSPADDAVEVPPGATLSLTFNGDVEAGSGSLFLRRTADNALVQIIPTTALTYSGPVASFQSAMLDFDTGYTVEIEEGALRPAGGGQPAAGVGPGAWDFTTSARFTEVAAGLPGGGVPSAAWGDYDNDGDLDLLISGWTGGSSGFTRLYRNEAGQFTDTGHTFNNRWGQLAWGDLESDGDLDILMSETLSGTYVYRNELALFTELHIYATGRGAAGWGDHDLDGDLDILQCDYPTPSTLLRNMGACFDNLHYALPSLHRATASWADTDGDGDLDLLLSGVVFSPSQTVNSLYRNNDRSLVFMQTLDQNWSWEAAWGDYDNDRDLDLIENVDIATRLYRNAGSFTDASAGLSSMSTASFAWGDLDNDGRLDLLTSGQLWPSGTQVTRGYLNLPGGFSALPDLPGSGYGALALGDMDNDGDLDLLVGIHTGSYTGVTRLYRNNSLRPNTAPQPPAAPLLSLTGTRLRLDWSEGSDAETPVGGLGYHAQIGIVGAAQPMLSGLADEATGFRRLPGLGNTGQAMARIVDLPFLGEPLLPQERRLVAGAVQAYDHAWAGSVFARDTLDLTGQMEYLGLHNSNLMRSSDRLSWDLRQTQALSGFEIQLADNPAFSPILGQTWLDGNPASRELEACVPLASLQGAEALQPNHSYYWRVRPVYADARRASVFSAQPGSFTLVALPQPPQQLEISVVDEDVHLAWQAVPGTFVYYVVYSSADAFALFPAGWQVAGPPTFETAWLDPQAAPAHKFYRVKAVVLE